MRSTLQNNLSALLRVVSGAYRMLLLLFNAMHFYERHFMLAELADRRGAAGWHRVVNIVR